MKAINRATVSLFLRNTIMVARCQHTDQNREVTPSADGCEECLKFGDH